VGLYTRLQGRADALIRKYGVQRTVTRYSGTPSGPGAAPATQYDPASGNVEVAGTTTPTVGAQFKVYMVTFPYEIRFVNDTTIKRTDLWGMFPAIELPDIPQPGDKLDMNGVQFTFGMVRPLQPGGVNIYYECHLTQG
jgi:hypothetical protein